MSLNLEVSVTDEWLRVDATGTFDLEQSVRGFPAVTAACRARGITAVLVDYRTVEGPAAMTEEIIYATRIGELYRQHLEEGGDPIRIAYLGNDSFVRTWSPGLSVLEGYGLHALVTTDLAESEEWLRNP